jgi:tetratricopeptide (TPR) repeat protein
MARTAQRRAAGLAARLTTATMWVQNLVSAQFLECLAVEPGGESLLEHEASSLQQPPAVLYHSFALFRAGGMRVGVRLGRFDQALALLETLLAPIERAPGWALGYVAIVCGVAETLWRLERTDHIDVIERNLRDKVIVPDFRTPMHDGQLAMAQLCALQGRYDEAVEWFAKARNVLDEQGARPLRAIVDFDEALMYVRRNASGDTERAGPLLEAALLQFRAIGMDGWITRAEALVP